MVTKPARTGEDKIMSKMAVPTMDVVRFREDDIIAASAGLFLPKPESEKLMSAGFHNGAPDDAAMNLFPVTAFVKALHITHGSLNVFFRYDENGAVRANDLLGYEENNVLENGVCTSKNMRDQNVLWTWIHQ